MPVCAEDRSTRIWDSADNDSTVDGTITYNIFGLNISLLCIQFAIKVWLICLSIHSREVFIIPVMYVLLLLFV